MLGGTESDGLEHGGRRKDTSPCQTAGIGVLRCKNKIGPKYVFINEKKREKEPVMGQRSPQARNDGSVKSKGRHAIKTAGFDSQWAPRAGEMNPRRQGVRKLPGLVDLKLAIKQK